MRITVVSTSLVSGRVGSSRSTLRNVLRTAWLAALPIAACGGGGGGGGSVAAPSNLSYSDPLAVYSKGVAIADNTPTVTGAVGTWSIAPALPAGLSLDAATGVIAGQATATMAETDFVVTARNAGGQATASLRLGVVRPALLAVAANLVDDTLSTFVVDARTGALRSTGYVIPTHSEVSPRGITALPTGEFVYVLNSITANIVGYSVDPTSGRLDALAADFDVTAPGPGGEPGGGGAPNEMILHPGADIGYVIQRFNPHVQTVAIDRTTGALTNLGAVASTGNGSESAEIDPSGRFLWVANIGSHSISTFTIDPVTHMPTAFGAAVPTQGVPTSMVLSENGDFLYVVNLDTNNLDVFAVAADGSLSSVAVVATGWFPTRIAIDPFGRYLFVAISSDDTIRTLEIDESTGIPVEIASTPTVGERPGTLVLDDTGTKLYACLLDSAEIAIFDVERASGALTPLGSARTRQQPLYFALLPAEAPADPKMRFAYVANSQSHDLAMLAPDPVTGELSKIDINMPSGNAPQGVIVDVRGRFAYAANTADDQVRTYAIDGTTGVLSEVGLPLATGDGPRSLAIDPSERFLYVGNLTSNTITIFDIDPVTGALSFSDTVAVGVQPETIACEPSGRFAYVANSGSNSISMLKINYATGALSPIAAPETTSASPRALVPHPSGRFLYSTLSTSGEVQAYSISASNGALVSLGALSSGVEPTSIAIDPYGAAAYVTNYDSAGVGDVSIFSIDPVSGVLTDLGFLPAGTNPIAAAVEPSGSFLYVINNTSDDITQFAIDAATHELTLVGTTASGTAPSAIAFSATLE